jgi:hypothetical protein
MNKKVMTVALVLLSISAINLFAQVPPALRGNYGLLSGYTYGYWAGLFGYGTATVSSSGAVAYSSYFPAAGTTGYGRGALSRTGAFSLNNGVSGKAQIYSNRVGYGIFSDSYGRGYFALGR